MSKLKVYVVTEGQYSDQHIVKVCLTKSLADNVVEDTIKEDWAKHGEQYQKHWNERVEEYRKNPQGNVGWNPDDWWGSWYASYDRYREHKLDSFEIEEYEVLE